MSTTITTTTMTSTDTPHTAHKTNSGWCVSWLPGRALSFDQACTAMTIAETCGRGRAVPGDRMWVHLQGWASELGLSTSDAVASASEES